MSALKAGKREVLRVRITSCYRRVNMTFNCRVILTVGTFHSGSHSHVTLNRLGVQKSRYSLRTEQCDDAVSIDDLNVAIAILPDIDLAIGHAGVVLLSERWLEPFMSMSSFHL
jgi:hypothetical protein